MKKSLPHSLSAFTLVELIVVIAVLAVLAMIAFTTVWNVTSSARNSARLTDVSTIVNKLEMHLSFGKVLPKPENSVDLIASGSVIGFQGEFGTNSARTIELSEIKDPLDSSHYTYTTDAKLGSYQVLAFNEVTTSYLPSQTVFAGTSKQPFTKGDILGILYDTTTNVPIEKTWPNTSVDIVNTFSGLTAQFSDSKQLSGTGIVFGGSMWSLLVKQSNFDAPKTCPQGYIPVPGNAEFLQPGFCVMKYEAKALGGVVNSGYNGHNYSASETIISNATDVPVVSLTQLQAITACNKLGKGYHLTTNNEWMTLARNIEAQSGNWSNGIVGSGYLYSGHNDSAPAYALVASADDTQGYINTGDTASIPDSGYTNYLSNIEQAYKGQKRTLFLSNKQIIWDLAGNIWEYSNKANTLNNVWHNNRYNLVSDACGGSGWYSFYNNDEVPQCGYINNYTYTDFWPLTPNIMTTINGIGRIFSNSVLNNIFLRGGHWGTGAYTGAFALALHWNDLNSNGDVGFRCAKY